MNEKFYLHNKQLIDQKINDCLINMALTAEDLKALTLANQLNNMTRAQFIAACGCDV